MVCLGRAEQVVVALEEKVETTKEIILVDLVEPRTTLL
jgi:hypothetical protein